MPKFNPGVNVPDTPVMREISQHVQEWHNRQLLAEDEMREARGTKFDRVANKDRITVEDQTEWWYGQCGAAALRKYSLDLAMRNSGFEKNSVDDVIDDAIKIENYLKGELRSPDDL